MTELNRLRWRCRRGLLELDIVLDRFLERHYATLSSTELDVFNTLLLEADATLWDMVSTTPQPNDTGADQLRVLAMLRQC